MPYIGAQTAEQSFLLRSNQFASAGEFSERVGDLGQWHGIGKGVLAKEGGCQPRLRPQACHSLSNISHFAPRSVKRLLAPKTACGLGKQRRAAKTSNASSLAYKPSRCSSRPTTPICQFSCGWKRSLRQSKRSATR